MMAEVKGKNRNNLTVVALIVAIVMTIATIFLHSTQGTDASFAESDAVAALLEPLLRRFYEFFCGVTALFGNVKSLEYEVFVRRLAHFIEYFLLCAVCTS